MPLKYTLVFSLLSLSSVASFLSNDARGDIIIDVAESGGDVTLSYTGTLDGTFTNPANYAILQTAFTPSVGTLRFNPNNIGLFQPKRFVLDGSISPFGPGTGASPSSVTGDVLLIGGVFGSDTVIVSSGVVPGVTNLSGEMTFSSTTINGLGIDLSGGPITLATIAGSGDTITMQASAVPEPSSFALALLAIVPLAFRRRRPIP